MTDNTTLRGVILQRLALQGILSIPCLFVGILGAPKTALLGLGIATLITLLFITADILYGWE